MRAFRMTKTLTSGNPAKLIFLFTIPLLIGNLFQQFYNMADSMICLLYTSDAADE